MSPDRRRDKALAHMLKAVARGAPQLREKLRRRASFVAPPPVSVPRPVMRRPVMRRPVIPNHRRTKSAQGPRPVQTPPPNQAEVGRARNWLCERRNSILGLTGDLCCEALLDRDSTVRLFYHSVLPALLSKRQPSHLLLQLCRKRGGVAESWHQESRLFGSSPSLQDNVPLTLALERLAEVVSSGAPYALRVVVEAPGSAHALLVLLRGHDAWLVDPNGDFGLVQIYFGSRNVLTSRLEELLEPLGCKLHVPLLPLLHRPEASTCSQEYCRGGACTYVTGAVAMRVLADRQLPEAVIASLASGGSQPPSVAREVDELVALTVACHVAGGSCTRLDLHSRVLQLVR
jgi:hypothetical protein